MALHVPRRYTSQPHHKPCVRLRSRPRWFNIYEHLKLLNEDELAALAEVLSDSVQDSQIPEDWLHSHLCPVPKPGKDLSSIKGYRIIYMQNTIGKLLEKVIAG